MELMEKQGFKQTEVGLIPTGWTCKAINDVCVLKHGFQFLDEHFTKNGIGVVKIGNLDDGKGIKEEHLTYVSIELANKLSHFLLKKGDVLMALTGGTLGKVSVVNTDKALLQNYRVGNFIPNSELDIKYLYQILTSFYLKNAVKKLVNEAAQPNFGKQDFDKLFIPIPPTLEEQKAIATALSNVDELISNLDKLITKKKAIKQGAMQQLLTPPHKGGKRLEGFSGEWEEKTIKEIVLTPVTDGPHETPRFVKEGIPFLSVNNIVNNKINYSDLRYISKEDDIIYSKKCKPKKYDILLGKAASVGKVAVVENDFDINIWSPLALIRCKSEYHYLFVFYSFQTSEMYKQIDGLTNSSSQGNIGMGDIEKLKIIFPNSTGEQKAISKILYDMDLEIKKLESKKVKYQSVKQGMMQELLTGKTRLV